MYKPIARQKGVGGEGCCISGQNWQEQVIVLARQKVAAEAVMRFALARPSDYLWTVWHRGLSYVVNAAQGGVVHAQHPHLCPQVTPALRK